MTMQRSDLSPATRIMVPTYAVFFTWVGLSALFTPLHRLMLTPGLRYTQDLVNLRVWGLLFLVVAADLVYALVRPRSSRARPTATYACLLGATVEAIWAIFQCWAVLAGQASPSAPAYAVLISVACYTTYRSILWRQ